MRLSLGLIVGVLAVAGAASAEPPKALAAEPSKPAQTPSKPAAIVLASADSVRAAPSDSAQSVASPAKRRVTPRVTSCRCGDAQVQSDSQDQ